MYSEAVCLQAITPNRFPFRKTHNTFQRTATPTFSHTPSPVVMAVNSPSARMDLGLKITFIFYLDSVLFRHFSRL